MPPRKDQASRDGRGRYIISKPSAQRDAAIAALAAQGMHTSEIARALNMDPEVVSRSKSKALADRTVTASVTDRAAYEMTLRGMQQGAIAKELGIDRHTVREGVKRAVQAIRAPAGQDLADYYWRMYSALLLDELSRRESPGIKHLQSGKPERTDPESGEPLPDVTAATSSNEAMRKILDAMRGMTGPSEPKRSIRATVDLDSQVTAAIDELSALAQDQADELARKNDLIEQLTRRAGMLLPAIESQSEPLEAPSEGTDTPEGGAES